MDSCPALPPSRPPARELHHRLRARLCGSQRHAAAGRGAQENGFEASAARGGGAPDVK